MTGKSASARVSPKGEETPSSPLPARRRARHENRSSAGPRLAPWQEHRAKELMRSNLAQTVSISDVAHRCRLSLSYFVRAFANTVGMAPYDWFLGQRIALAKELLVQKRRRALAAARLGAEDDLSARLAADTAQRIAKIPSLDAVVLGASTLRLRLRGRGGRHRPHCDRREQMVPDLVTHTPHDLPPCNSAILAKLSEGIATKVQSTGSPFK
jgi:AraC-like DNA-binding protein